MSTTSDWVLTPVPTALDAREMLSGLLGREVTVQMTDTFVGDVGDGATYAVYQDDQARTRAVAVMDLAMSAYAGAAIGLMPVGAAEVAIEEKDLSPVVQENLGARRAAAFDLSAGCSGFLYALGIPEVGVAVARFTLQAPLTATTL